MDGMEVFKDAEAAVKGRRRSEAVQELSYLVETQPSLKQDWLKVAKLSLVVGESQLAVKAAELFGQSVPRSLDNDIQKAGIFAEAGELKKALKVVEPIAKKDVPAPSVYHMVGTIQAQLGELESARSHLSKALALSPQLGISWYTLASITDFKKVPPVLEKLVQAEQAFSKKNNKEFALYCYAKGKAFSDVGEYEKSQAAYQQGAKLFMQLQGFDMKADAQAVKEIIENTTKATLTKVPDSTIDYQRPVAILGLPRSGTTLLGQILGSHPEFKGSGEFNALTAAIMHLPYKDLVDFPSFMERHGNAPMAIDFMTQVYQNVTDQRFAGSAKVVDKTLSLNRHFGIFSKVLPKAKAIYITRNVDDIAWSCFKTPFRSNYSWSWHPETIAAFIKSEHKLIEHWKSIFPDRILTIAYEDLVSAPEETLKTVCAHLDIDYDKKMLAFHKSGLPVFTSSVGQVHKPLNDTAVNGARHYSEFVKAFRTFYDAE